jgi:hypothetical protein
VNEKHSLRDEKRKGKRRVGNREERDSKVRGMRLCIAHGQAPMCVLGRVRKL